MPTSLTKPRALRGACSGVFLLSPHQTLPYGVEAANTASNNASGPQDQKVKAQEAHLSRTVRIWRACTRKLRRPGFLGARTAPLTPARALILTTIYKLLEKLLCPSVQACTSVARYTFARRVSNAMLSRKSAIVHSLLHGKGNKRCSAQISPPYCTNRMRHFALPCSTLVTPKLLHVCAAPQALSHATKGGGPPSQRSQGGCLVQLGRRDSPRTLLHAYSWCANHTKASTPSHSASGSAHLLKHDHSEEPTSTEGEMTVGPSPGPRRRRGQVQCKQVGRARQNTCVSTQTAYRASSESCGIQVSAAILFAQTPATWGAFGV